MVSYISGEPLTKFPHKFNVKSCEIMDFHMWNDAKVNM